MPLPINWSKSIYLALLLLLGMIHVADPQKASGMTLCFCVHFVICLIKELSLLIKILVLNQNVVGREQCGAEKGMPTFGRERGVQGGTKVNY